MSDLKLGAPYTKAERLLNLLMALRNTQSGLSREQLRVQVRGYDRSGSDEAFERMFERDKEELRGLGLPITTLTDANGTVTGYRASGQWSLPSLHFTAAELAVVSIAARIWQNANLAPDALNALRKVETSLGVTSQQPAVAHIAGMDTDAPDLARLIEACTAGVAIGFGYRKSSRSEPERRHIQPWGVVWWHRHWYLVGYDLNRSDVRVFRASRIQGSIQERPHAQLHPKPDEVDLRDLLGRFVERDRVTLRASVADGVGATVRQHGQVLGVDEHGWTELDIAADSIVEGVASVLALGASARILNPPSALTEAHRQLHLLGELLASEPVVAGRQIGLHRATPGTAQFSRLLALVPWLAANDGVSISEAAAHFGVSADQLAADLGSVITSGSDDWNLFDIQYWDENGIITVIDALDLDTPLSLSPDEGCALLVALHALAEVPGNHDRAVLESATAALTSALGSRAPAQGTVNVRVDTPANVQEHVTEALDRGRVLHLIYLGAARDEVTNRVVDPLALVVVDGYSYLRAYCRSRAQIRMFRTDRILDLTVGSEVALPVTDETESVEPMAAILSGTGLRVTLDLPAGSTFNERHPVLRRWALAGGGYRAEVPIGDFDWARKLVLSSAGQVVLREPQWLVQQLIQTVEACQARLAEDPQAPRGDRSGPNNSAE